ncbi:alpha/beta fold hydrolase [Verticiella sediminum]|uniref:Alpha/beta fold hydrolase n=1 Tax=Verticiella sediminum TaxID=1247510 RepID=A0A556AYF7_9BURK|nr:alpha/beta fold hydrolase [Verticiella sediminum]TSH97984.1 alpha/beta fold hydrolase [Verticiella sediminum]
MPIVEVGSARVFYRVEGQGPGLVLVHGTGGDSFTNWAQVAPAFADAWTVVRPDYAGSGQTEDDGAALTVPLLAEQVLGAADAAGLDCFDLVGFSLGSAVAVHLAAHWPQRVRRLVLTAGFAHARGPRMQLQFSLWTRLMVEDRRSFCELAMLTGFSPAFLAGLTPAMVEELVQIGVQGNPWEGMLRQTRLDAELDVSEALARITQPTLVIGCTHDHMAPPAHARELAQAIPGASYVELESGHLLPMEAPERFIAAVRPFLAAR